DTFGPSGGVEDPKHVFENILDSIKHAKAVAEAYRKILKSSSFDSETKTEIHNAIALLIRKWREVQSTLERKDSDKPKATTTNGKGFTPDPNCPDCHGTGTIIGKTGMEWDCWKCRQR